MNQIAHPELARPDLAHAKLFPGEQAKASKRQSTETPTQASQRLVFIPFSEVLMERAGSPLGTLVPFDLSYDCVRLADGTYDFCGLKLA